MRQRALGATTVTAVGSGDLRMPTARRRRIDAREVELALHQGLTLGITLVEAGEPDAERLCGDALRALRLRDRVVLATRIPTVPPMFGRPNRDVLPEQLPARYVQERVEAALRATRLDVLPLVQLAVRPAWRDSPAWPELAGTCERLVREGKAVAWGAIVDDADHATAAAFVEDPWLVALNVTFNACARSAATLLGSRLAILAGRPLAGGALAGRLGPGVRLSPEDDRRALDDTTLERIAVAVARLAPLVRIEPPAARSCDLARAALERGRRPPDVEVYSVAELALRYVIDRDAIALPRLHRSEHLAEAIAAASAPPLSQSLRERLDEVVSVAPGLDT